MSIFRFRIVTAANGVYITKGGGLWVCNYNTVHCNISREQQLSGLLYSYDDIDLYMRAT